MRWKSNGTFHRLNRDEKEFLCDIMEHYLAETEEMLETATNDNIFITDTDDLLKVTGLIYTRRKLAYELTEEFDYA
tara:strand:+ start:1620 stop:1847 length:228 start_codon:yes stop_codon:yes gene_type:complete